MWEILGAVALIALGIIIGGVAVLYKAVPGPPMR